MKTFLYCIWQATWGFLQSALGLFVLIFHIRDKHYLFHGAIVTEWKSRSSVSLGMFVFITSEPYFYDKLKNEYSLDDLSSRLLVHEYGHTVQSLILGPFYLIIMGIPSTLWGFLPHLNAKRKSEQISYFSFFTERWANYLGEKVLGMDSVKDLVID